MFGSSVTRRETDSPFIATHQGNENVASFSVRFQYVTTESASEDGITARTGDRRLSNSADDTMLKATSRPDQSYTCSSEPKDACSRDAHTGASSQPVAEIN